MLKTSGALFLLSGLLIVMGIILAEISYPVPYSIGANMISNLGSTPPPHSIVYEPSARIFDFSLILAGIFAIVGALLLHKEKKHKFLALSLLLTGAGTTGVGLFPAYNLYPHILSALTAFGAGGISALLASRSTKAPFSFISFILGSVTFGCLLLNLLFPEVLIPVLGRGGAERIVAYPAMLWLIAFGGYLLNS